MIGIGSRTAIAMAVLMIMASACILADGSDAYTSTYSLEYETGQTVDRDLTSLTGKGLMVQYSGSAPEGLSIDIVQVSSTLLGHGYRTYLRGTVTAQPGTYSVTLTDDIDFYEFRILVTAGECTITYDAGIGLVKGSQTWSETVTKGSYASMPVATHSSGAYTFLGWATSATASEPLDSFAPIQDVTLHAVWKRNTVQISDATATITSGQTATLPLNTNPEEAVVSVTSSGGLPYNNIYIRGHEAVLDMTGVEPGTYYVTLSASYTGYISGESVITVKVPITIVKPIEYVLTQGDRFSYTPVTNPTNACITLVSATLDGNVLGNLDL